MPLKLVLKPHERVVLNQAVIVNGRQKAELILENKASVLRERDIMTEEGADSPAKKVYFVVQMMYLFPKNMRFYQDKFNTNTNNLPITLDVSNKVLTLPLYPNMTHEEKIYLVNSIFEYFESKSKLI